LLLENHSELSIEESISNHRKMAFLSRFLCSRFHGLSKCIETFSPQIPNITELITTIIELLKYDQLHIIWGYVALPCGTHPTNTHESSDPFQEAVLLLEQLVTIYVEMSETQIVQDFMWKMNTLVQSFNLPVHLKFKVLKSLPTISFGISEYGQWQNQLHKIPSKGTAQAGKEASASSNSSIVEFFNQIDPWQMLEDVHGNPIALHLHSLSSTV